MGRTCRRAGEIELAPIGVELNGPRRVPINANAHKRVQDANAAAVDRDADVDVAAHDVEAARAGCADRAVVGVGGDVDPFDLVGDGCQSVEGNAHPRVDDTRPKAVDVDAGQDIAADHRDTVGTDRPYRDVSGVIAVIP